MQLSRRGICYNLEETPYIYTMIYSDNEYTFHFSSQLNQDKFIERIQENRNKISISLTKRFKMNLQPLLLSDIHLYSNVERRGFLVSSGENKWQNLKSIKLDGQMKIINA